MSEFLCVREREREIEEIKRMISSYVAIATTGRGSYAHPPSESDQIIVGRPLVGTEDHRISGTNPGA